MSSQITPARLAAFRILLDIESKGAHSSASLARAEELLETRDRALCHTLVLGVLRRKLFLDRIIESFSEKNIRKFDLEVLVALRLALFQIISLERIPSHAVLNESVNLVRHAKKTSAASMVNAILRRVTREEQFRFSFADETEKLSIETSHPRWLIERWKKQFGFEETRRIVNANNAEAIPAFRLTRKSDKSTISLLRESGAECSPSEIAEGAFRLKKRSPLLDKYMRDGKIYFQEEASQLVATSFPLGPKEKFLDVCASPGGKTTLISLHAGGREGNRKHEYFLAAGDVSWRRISVLKETCQRVGEESVAIAVYDALSPLPFKSESFDAVLLDAPCSGTGTLRSNPEIRYRLSEDDFARLSAKQSSMLQNASKLVKAGGRICYSTCSLEKDENEIVVEEFLRRELSFRKITPNVGAEFRTADGFARTFPHRDDCDGFFLAALVRV